MITIFNRLSEGGGGRADSRAVREQLGERAGVPGLRLDGGPALRLYPAAEKQLRIMEEYTGEDGLPLFTEMLIAKVFSESWIFRA